MLSETLAYGPQSSMKFESSSVLYDLKICSEFLNTSLKREGREKELK